MTKTFDIYQDIQPALGNGRVGRQHVMIRAAVSAEDAAACCASYILVPHGADGPDWLIGARAYANRFSPEKAAYLITQEAIETEVCARFEDEGLSARQRKRLRQKLRRQIREEMGLA